MKKVLAHLNYVSTLTKLIVFTLFLVFYAAQALFDIVCHLKKENKQYEQKDNQTKEYS